MKRYLLFAALLLSCPLAAQDENQPALLKPYSFLLGAGMHIYSDPPLTIADFQKIAPGSTLLANDFSTFVANNGFYYPPRLDGSFYLSAEFMPWSKRKNDYRWHTKLRGSVMFTETSLTGMNYSRDEYVRFDTVTSSNGIDFYLDSTKYESYSFSWNQQVFGIEIGQTFHTNDARLVSAWVGYGIYAGIGMNTYFRGRYNRNETVHMTSSAMVGNHYPSALTWSSGETAQEDIRTGSVFLGRLSFPIGVQFRCSRKMNRWNKLAFTAESRMSIDLQQVPGMGTMTRFFYMQTWGVKYFFQHNVTKG